MNERCTAEGILEVFGDLTAFLKSKKISKFIYKPVPHIYHRIPSEEDLYALFRQEARLTVRNISSVIRISTPLPWTKLRKRMVKKAVENSVMVKESTNFALFWDILTANLQEKYSARPVHSLDEMTMLASRFPEIKLYAAFIGEEMTGGVLCYFTQNVVKVQYISASPIGKETGAIDAIFEYLLRNCKDYSYFDYGTSNEDNGRYLNASLIHQKEGFGGRAVCYDTYQINL